MPDTTQQQPDLYNAAYDVFARYQSTVVPANGKRPLVPSWQKYQTHVEEPRRFSYANATTIGIVLRRGLVVVDLDTQEQVERFERSHPALWNTTRERTPKGGYHLFYTVNRYADIKEMHFNGSDLKVSTFVVCAPSLGYTLEYEAPILRLTQDEIYAIIATLKGEGASNDLSAAPSAAPGSAAPLAIGSLLEQMAAKITVVDAAPAEPEPLPVVEDVTENELVSYYTAHMQEGRNNALFATGTFARDKGFTVDQALDSLLSLHVAAPAPAGHRKETAQQRSREGKATLKSAFNRAPKVTDKIKDEALLYSLAEGLHRVGEKATAKCYLSLLQSGYRGGDVINREIIKTASEPLAGDWSQRKFYGFLEIDHKVSPGTPCKNAPLTKNEKSGLTTPYARCSESKPTKNKKGRPAHQYVMPTVYEIANEHGIKLVPSTLISLDNPAQGVTFSCELLKSLIKRRNGRPISNYTLALIYGVSSSTIIRWKKTASIRSVSIGHGVNNVNFQAIFQDNERVEHKWLEDETGKRYPFQRVMAAKLMKQGKRVTWHDRFESFAHFTQDMNMKRPQIALEAELSQNQPAAGAATTSSPQPEQPATEAATTSNHDEQPATLAELGNAHLEGEKIDFKDFLRLVSGFVGAAQQRYDNGQGLQGSKPPAKPRRTMKFKKVLPGGNYSKPLADNRLEGLANHLQYKINFGTDADKHIPLHRVRQAIMEQGEEAATRAASYVSNRERINKPAAYFIRMVGI